MSKLRPGQRGRDAAYSSKILTTTSEQTAQILRHDFIGSHADLTDGQREYLARALPPDAPPELVEAVIAKFGGPAPRSPGKPTKPDLSAAASAEVDALPIPYATSRKPLGKFQQWWNDEKTWGEFREMLLDVDGYTESSRKEEGGAISTFELYAEPNTAANERRNQTAVKGRLLISDHDDGRTMAESEALARSLGHEAVIVPTFSYGATTLIVTVDDFKKWRPDAKMTEALGREYLEDTGKLVPRIASVAKLLSAEAENTAKGIGWLFETPPLEKHRVFRVIKTTIVPAEYVNAEGITNKQFAEGFKEGIEAALRSFNATFDTSCTDVARMYWWLCRRKGAPRVRAIHVPGEPFDFDPFLREGVAKARAGRARQRTGENYSKSGAKLVAWKGRNLTAWAAKYAKSFDVESLFDSTTYDKGPRTGGGLCLECFIDGHGGTSPSETYCISGDGEKGFVLHCSGHTDGHCDLDRLEMLVGYLDAGFVSIEDLEREDYGGGPVPWIAGQEPKPGRDEIKAAIKALSKDYAADDLKPIIDAVAEIDDPSFDSEVKRLLKESPANISKGDSGDMISKSPVRKARREAEKEKKKQKAFKIGGSGLVPPTVAENLEAANLVPLLVSMLASGDGLRFGTRPNDPSYYCSFESLQKDAPDVFERDMPVAERIHAWRKTLDNQTLVCGTIGTKLDGTAFTVKYDKKSEELAFCDIGSRFLVVAAGDNGSRGNNDQRNPSVCIERADGSLITLRVSELRDLEAITNFGLLIDQYEPFRQIVNYAARNVPRRIVVPERCGWNGKAFLKPSGEVVGDTGEVELVPRGVPKPAWTRGGDEAESNKTFGYCVGNSRLMIAIALAEAAPWIDSLDIANFLINLFGPSSIGKTTVIYVAASVWGVGNQENEGGIVMKQPMTLYALEQFDGPAHNHMPFMHEELKSLVPARDLQSFIHQFSAGMGKSAGGKGGLQRERRPYRTLGLIAGENEIRAMMRAEGLNYEGGESVRAIDIPAVAVDLDLGVLDRVPSDFRSSEAFIAYLQKQAATHHGHLADKIITHIAGLEEPATTVRAIKDEIATIRKSWGEKFGNDAQVGRVLDNLAAVAGIAEYHTEVGLTPWRKAGDVIWAFEHVIEAWHKLRGGGGSLEALEAERAQLAYETAHVGGYMTLVSAKSEQMERCGFDIKGYYTEDDGHSLTWYTDELLAAAVGGVGRVASHVARVKSGHSKVYELVCDPGRDKRTAPSGWKTPVKRLYCFRRKH